MKKTGACRLGSASSGLARAIREVLQRRADVRLLRLRRHGVVQPGRTSESMTLLSLVLTLTILPACGVQTASRDQSKPMLFDRHGRVSAAESQDTVKEISSAAQADTNTVATLISTVNSLSDVPVYQDNQVELLIDGPATYASMLEAIASAEHHIFLETYIFANDEAGREFAAALIKKSRELVDVKVIYDSLGSILSEEELFATMEDAGVELIEYNNIDPMEGGNPLTINNRNHRKLLVVDNKVAYTGGINLASSYSSGSGAHLKRDVMRQGWRDTHIAVRGPAVRGFEEIFVRNWESLDGAINRSETAAPDGHPGGEVVAILTAKGGDGESSAIFAAYLDAMQLAEQRIWITQAYFAPSTEFLGVLECAAARGVDVRLLVPGVSDSALVLNASRSRYDRLLGAGVRIYENQHAVLHAKTAVVDGIWSTVGSSNLDSRSFLHNDEVNAIIFGVEFGKKMEAQFRHDLSQASEITLTQWRTRSTWSRMLENLSWTIEYWL